MSEQKNVLSDNSLNKVPGGLGDMSVIYAEQLAKLVEAYQKGKITLEYLNEEKDRINCALCESGYPTQDLSKLQKGKHIGDEHFGDEH